VRAIYLIFISIIAFPVTTLARQDVDNNDSTAIINLLHDAVELFDNQPNSSLALAERAGQIAREIKSIALQSMAERTLGNFYSQLGEYDIAAQHYFNALELTGNQNTIAAAIFNRLGDIMRQNGSFEDAYKYHKQSLYIYTELNDSMGLAYSFNNIGLAHELVEDFDSALFYHHKSLKIKEAMGNIPGMADSYSNMGTIYRKTGEPEKALEMQLKTLEIDLEQGDKVNIAITHNNLGVLYMDLDSLSLAAFHLDKALKLSTGAKATDINKYANQQLAALHEKLGDHEKAYHFYKTYSALKDSLFNEDKSKEIGKLEAKYEFEKAEEERKRLEIEELRLENEIKQRRDNLQYSGILIFMLLLFLAVFLLIARFKSPLAACAPKLQRRSEGGRLPKAIRGVSPRFAEGLIFFTFLLFFEFTLVLLDPYIEQYSSGAPATKLAFNAVLAGLIFPLHSFFEEQIKQRIVKSK